MRPISQEVYGIPRERVIGSTSVLAYAERRARRHDHPRPGPDFLDDGPEKPIRIWSRTGRRPLLAAGNANGDIPMLDFAQQRRQAVAAAPRRSTTTPSASSTTPRARSRRCKRRASGGWTTVSVRDDWSTVF